MRWAGVDDAGDTLLVKQLVRRVERHHFQVIVGFNASNGEQVLVMAQAVLEAAPIAEPGQFQPRQVALAWRGDDADALSENAGSVRSFLFRLRGVIHKERHGDWTIEWAHGEVPSLQRQQRPSSGCPPARYTIRRRFLRFGTGGLA